MSSDEASRLNLHRDRKQAGYAPLGCHVVDQNGPAVAVDSETCESPGSEESKAGVQSRLEQRSAHRTSPHDLDVSDTRRCHTPQLQMRASAIGARKCRALYGHATFVLKDETSSFPIVVLGSCNPGAGEVLSKNGDRV